MITVKGRLKYSVKEKAHAIRKAERLREVEELRSRAFILNRTIFKRNILARLEHGRTITGQALRMLQQAIEGSVSLYLSGATDSCK